MKFVSLDHIAKSVINQKGYTMHWYFEYLKHGADCLRELHFDVLRNVRAKKIPVNSYKSIPLPCDYVDWVKVGIGNGQMITPLVQHTGINRLTKIDDSGNKTLYGTTGTDWLGYWGNACNWYFNTNDYGEFLGGYYNYRQSAAADGFRVLRDRSEIQLSELLMADFIILEYISNGAESDAATMVDPYAQAAIEAYIHWKSNKQVMNNWFSPEGQMYKRQVEILRARKNDLSVDDIKRIINRERHGAPK